MAVDEPSNGGVSKRIVEARGELSRAAAAIKLGVHKNTLTNYEHGSRLPDAEFLQAVYREFGISPTWVLTGQEPKYIQPGIAVALLLVDALQKGKGFSIEQQRALADDDTFTAYLSGKCVPPPEFLIGFAEMTGYPLARLNAAHELCQAQGQMEGAAAQIAAAPRMAATPRINVDALAAILEGALKVAKNAPASTIAAHAASVYAKCIEDGLITPDGIGNGKMDDAV